jgi:pyruvate dehydrogenase E2 component (dihydrolipoamide acetyltransferase)
MSVLNLPDLGEGLQSAEIVSWHVAAGDHVVTGQPLVSVETDKAVVEVPAPRAGTVASLCAAEGDTVDVGAPLVEFSDEAAADSGTVVGHLAAAPEPAAEAPTESALDTAPQGTAAPSDAAAPVAHAAPRVRALARKLGVDLASVTATGPGGAILASDVENATGGGEKLRGVRLAMAERMAAAHRQVVHASVHDLADVDAWPEDTDVMLRLVQAVAAACMVEPALNCWLDSDGMRRRLHDHVDLGIAVDTADGLFVPTLRDVSARDDAGIRDGLERIRRDVLDRSIPIGEMRGQTITLSNFGAIGGRYAELVVVPPQVAIVGAGRVSPAVVPVDGQPAIRRILPLSLTFDHRAVTGGEAARFLAAMVEHLEQPEPTKGEVK